jgi:hypothetical protein
MAKRGGGSKSQRIEDPSRLRHRCVYRLKWGCVKDRSSTSGAKGERAGLNCSSGISLTIHHPLFARSSVPVPNIPDSGLQHLYERVAGQIAASRSSFAIEIAVNFPRIPRFVKCVPCSGHERPFFGAAGID